MTYVVVEIRNMNSLKCLFIDCILDSNIGHATTHLWSAVLYDIWTCRLRHKVGLSTRAVAGCRLSTFQLTDASLYRRVHPTMGIGLWLVLLVIRAVIGGDFNVR